MRGAQAPNTVGGGQAHPPRVDRHLDQEDQPQGAPASPSPRPSPLPESTALASARGHTLPKELHLPVVLEDPVEEIVTTKDARALLERLHLWDDVERARNGIQLQVRAGLDAEAGADGCPGASWSSRAGPGRARGFRNLVGRRGRPRPAPRHRASRPRRGCRSAHGLLACGGRVASRPARGRRPHDASSATGSSCTPT